MIERCEPPRVLIMRICFINLLYSIRDKRGGLGEHIADLSQALSHRGHDVTVLTSGARGESREGAVRVVALGALDPFARRGQLIHPTYTLSRLRYLWRLRQHVAGGRYDVVEAADGGFEHLFMLWNRPCAIVTKLHGNFRQFHPDRLILMQVIHPLETAAVRASDAIYASSSAHAAVACRDYDLPADRIAVIPCGIDWHASPQVSDAAAIADRFPGTRGRRIVLLSVGSSPGRKGARVLIETAGARDWGDVCFVLLMADRGFLDGLALPANVLVLPPQEKPIFRALMAAAAVIVFPSTFESFSIATHEAMLLGRPVIVSRHVPLDPPASEYPWMAVLDRVDAGALSSALMRMLDGERSPAAMTADIRQQLHAAYDIDAVADATLALYRDAQARRHRF